MRYFGCSDHFIEPLITRNIAAAIRKAAADSNSLTMFFIDSFVMTNGVRALLNTAMKGRY